MSKERFEIFVKKTRRAESDRYEIRDTRGLRPPVRIWSNDAKRAEEWAKTVCALLNSELACLDQLK